ncbi:hypothetical protein QJS04_geneDACA000558 [Acorus gramineus]|uniref:J domain-containing protein n=1 Tax=Acorus gramineus TaxID=55184 RepID=A0AAV9AT48_ACOGR|nr:hypothetical protein QJS04_geneDACA000558 [Acorus gramineus]
MADLALLKRYAIPLIMLSLAVFYQLYVLPSSFPTSHYDVLGLRRFASVEEVTEAYERLSSKWNSGVEVPPTTDFIKIRYAFELLTNPLWKRDYDKFGIDENLHVLEKVKGEHAGESVSKVGLPLLDTESIDDSLDAFVPEDFMSNIGNDKPWLIQIYSSGSSRCAQFTKSWKRIASVLDGVANTAALELGDYQLAAHFAERKSSGQPYFKNGLPSLVALPNGCRRTECVMRYDGDLSVDSVVDWVATSVLGLPRILYYSKETLGQNFIAKSGPHKVKVICFSKTGERAAPFLRRAAKDYWAYASFAFVLWKEEESSVWWNAFQVESAPSIVILKDPGLEPVIHHGPMNSSWFASIIEQNKQFDLPQLRSTTSLELGCDAKGYSRAGNDTAAWYCVVLAGRPSLKLNQMRNIMRNVQSMLVADTDESGKIPVPKAAADAFNTKRLTFTWLDGETQKKYCFFYLHSEDSYETCGPRRYGDPTDTPRLFIIRYKRNATESTTKVEKKVKTIWDTLQEEDANLASQLVARYNGSEDKSEITQWISQIIDDGDTRDLPYYRITPPELIPEQADQMLLKGAEGILSKGKGMKQRFQNFAANILSYAGDPRIGPILLLGACFSFATIWLQSNQNPQQPDKKVESESENPTQPEKKVEGNARRRNRPLRSSNHDRPSSITDEEPKDAHQVTFSDSDSD